MDEQIVNKHIINPISNHSIKSIPSKKCGEVENKGYNNGSLPLERLVSHYELISHVSLIMRSKNKFEEVNTTSIQGNNALLQGVIAGIRLRHRRILDIQTKEIWKIQKPKKKRSAC